MAPRVIFYAYPSSPYAIKIALLLLFKRIPFSLVAVKNAPPTPTSARPELELLGVTYRRVPVLAIDGDIFCDSALIAEELDRRFPSKGPAGEPSYASVIPGPADAPSALLISSMDTLSNRLFGQAVALLPEAVLSDKAFVKDRETMTGRPFNYATLSKAHPLTLSALRSTFATLERQASRAGKGRRFILGTTAPSYADISLYFPLAFIMMLHGSAKSDLNKQVLSIIGDKQRFPSAVAWLEKMHAAVGAAKKAAGWKPWAISAEKDVISGEEAAQLIRSAPKLAQTEPALVHIDAADPAVAAGWVPGKAGADAQVTPTDTGRIPQPGKLVGLTPSRVTLELSSGAHVHFPRVDYAVTAAKPSKM